MKYLGIYIGLLFAISIVTAADEPAKKKPNILHIHADDHRADGLQVLGTSVLKTPNLDAVAKRGLIFSHCYTQGSMVGAVCLPSRTMLLTGRSWQRIPKPTEGDVAATLPRVLAAVGYQTFHVGKGGNEYKAGLNAFEINLIDDAKGGGRAQASERHADATIQFLKERKKDSPFYVYFAPPVPHDPREAAPEFHKLYSAADVTLSPAFMPQHPFNNGEMTVRDENLAPWPRTPENTKQQLADYYACLTGLDFHVGRVFEQLKSTGDWENTIVIFSSDNGLSMGEHGLFGKQNLYEFGGMHVPFIIAGPGIPQGKREALVYLMDLFPTFCEFAGAKLPAGVDGKSLVPVIEGKSTKVRDVLYTGYRNVQRAIRDDRWKLIRYPQVDRTQLFDLANDPRELNNLADKPEHAAKVAELMEKLQKEMTHYDDMHPLKVSDPQPAEWSPPKQGDGGRKEKQKKKQKQ